MAGKRYCAECGSGRRMEGLPEGETLCRVCSGQERHPADVMLEAQKSGGRMWMKGVYDDRDPAVGPGQGGVEFEKWSRKRDAERYGGR